MEKSGIKDRFVFILMGALATAVIFLLVGATDIAAPHYGRYQVSAWSSPVGRDAVGVGAFIVDTATGETRMVFNRSFTASELDRKVKNELCKTFHGIK